VTFSATVGRDCWTRLPLHLNVTFNDDTQPSQHEPVCRIFSFSSGTLIINSLASISRVTLVAISSLTLTNFSY
jgi:hypothetical protein